MVVTADWKEVRLGDLGMCLRGVSYKGDSDLSDGDTPTTVRLLRSNNVQNSLIQFNDVQYVNHDCVSDEQILRRDDIVICMANGSKVLVGKTGLYKDSQDARFTFGAFMGCFRSSSDQAHAIFVRYLFLTKQYQDYISNLLAGSSINNLTPKSIESLLFNVPPLKEQEAIAEALSDADAAIESLDALIAKKRDVKQATMQQLLTGRTRLPGFNADWKEIRLGDICEFVKTIALSRSQLEADRGVGCIHYGDIHTKFNDRLDCSNVQLPMAESGIVVGVPRLKVGDLVIADASEDMTGVGKGIEILGIPEYGVVAGLHTAVLRPQVGYFAKGFLGQLQHMPKFREQARVLASGLKVYGLSKTSISKISLKIPPLKEQEAIAEALTVMDDELEALTEQVSKLRMIKEGMMQDLLTGKVRLV